MNTITNNSGNPAQQQLASLAGHKPCQEPSKRSSATCSRLAQEKRCPPQTRGPVPANRQSDKRSKLVLDIADNFPQELLDRNQWVCWKLENPR
jgi:hypothetical protein